MKTVVASFFALFLCLNLKAQSNFHKISIGGGFGSTTSYSDVQKRDYGLAGYGTFNYYFTPFFSMGAELQKGEIAGGDVATDPHERQFINSFNAFTLNGKLALGSFIDYSRNGLLNAIKHIYAGAGVGVIHNNMKSIVRYKPSDTDYKFPGVDSGNDVVFPLNLGVNFYLGSKSGIKKLAINLNLQGNVTIGEGMDGYNDSPIVFKNNNPDIYTYYSIGLKYHFGLVGISKKYL
ncbi:MAG: hypothetical protein EOO92_00180 [Pedobacter sp.]|nr:MAG: hypothetical protein EOO92_00180 [Pedobacter sp.]